MFAAMGVVGGLMTLAGLAFGIFAREWGAASGLIPMGLVVGSVGIWEHRKGNRMLDHLRDEAAAVTADDPANWKLAIGSEQIDLYSEVSRTPRPLSADEARMLVELVDAWRGLEHRNYIALDNAKKDG